MPEIDIAQAIKFCQELPVLRERLHRVGLHKTACKMDAAVHEIGCEVADHIEAERNSRKK